MSPTGIQDLDEGRKMLLKNKSQVSGTSSHYKEQLSLSTHDTLTNRFHVTHYGGCAILFNKDTFYPNIDVKSLYLHDTRRDLPDKVVEGDQVWVLQGVLSRASFRRPPLSGHKTFTVLSLPVSNIYSKKNDVLRKSSSSQSDPLRLVNILTWLQVISMEQRGDAATETTSVPSAKPLLTSLCQRRRAPHHCGDPDRSQTIGLTFAGFLNRLIQIGIGRYACMVLAPSHEKL